VRIIEAILASFLLFACLALIPAPSSNVQNSTINLALTGQNVLSTLDSNGHLADLIHSQNWAELKDCLESALPLTVWFNLTVFDQNIKTVNPFPICNAGTASDNIFSIDYICASQNGTYTIYILRLQLSEVGLT